MTPQLSAKEVCLVQLDARLCLSLGPLFATLIIDHCILALLEHIGARVPHFQSLDSALLYYALRAPPSGSLAAVAVALPLKITDAVVVVQNDSVKANHDRML